MLRKDPEMVGADLTHRVFGAPGILVPNVWALGKVTPVLILSSRPTRFKGRCLHRGPLR